MIDDFYEQPKEAEKTGFGARIWGYKTCFKKSVFRCPIGVHRTMVSFGARIAGLRGSSAFLYFIRKEAFSGP